jgi:hypothetical protein
MATKRPSGSDQVTIACKLPQGLHIKLPSTGKMIKLHGSATPYAVAGHGMTSGITGAQWDEIEATYPDALWHKSGAVFVSKRKEDASAQAVERKAENVGFNPIDPKDPSLKGIGINIEAA